MSFFISLLTGGLGLLKRLPWQLLAALGVFAGVSLLWHMHTSAVSHARADGFADGRIDATSTFIAAQAEAERLATIDKQIKDAQNETARTQSAEAYADLSGRYRATVLRLSAKADPGRAGKIHLSGHAESPGLPETPPGNTFVSISQSDALICGQNTAYAVASFEWARQLEHPE